MPPMQLPAEILDMIKDSPHSSCASNTYQEHYASSDTGDDDDDDESSPSPASATEQPGGSAQPIFDLDDDFAADPKDAEPFKITSDLKPSNAANDLASTPGPNPDTQAGTLAPAEITIAAVKEVLAELGGKVKSSEKLTAMMALPIFRAARLAPVWAGRRIIWERVINVEAIVTQCVGIECSEPCNRCSLNLGPFEGCYSVPGLTSSCGNCNYNSQGHRCSNNPKNIGRVPIPRGKRNGSLDGSGPRKKKKVHSFRGAVSKAPTTGGSNAVAAGSSASQAGSSSGNPTRFAPSLTPGGGSGTANNGERTLTVPIPAEFGLEDAMMLRRVLHEITEQLIFQQQDTRQIRKMLRDLSGSLEDYASEMQD